MSKDKEDLINESIAMVIGNIQVLSKKSAEKELRCGKIIKF